MATIVYNVNTNTAQAQRNINSLYTKSQKLFQKGFDVDISSKSITGFSRSLDQATDRILSFTATTILISKTSQALVRLTTDAIKVQTAIQGIQSILNATNSDLAGFQDSLFKIANQTGVSFFDAADAAQEFSRVGLSLNKTLEATAAALGIVRTSGGNVKDVVEGLVAAVNSFEGENLGFTEIADKLTALDAAFSTSAQGLIQAFSRSGVAAADAGVQFDEFLAIVSSVRQISARSEAQIGNSIKAILTSLQSEKGAELLENFGIATKEASGEFRSATDVIRDLASAFTTLSDAQKAFIGEKLAGKFQINAFKTLIQAFQGGLFDKASGISQGADGDIAKRIALLNETTATAIQRIQNSITELGSTLGDAVGRNFVEGLLKYGDSGIGLLKKLFEKGNPIGDFIASGLTAALTGPGIVLGATLLSKLFIKTFSSVVEAGRELIKNVDTIAKTNTELKQQLSLNNQINQTLSKRQSLAKNAQGVSLGAIALQQKLVAEQTAKQQSRQRLGLGFSFAAPAAISGIASTLDDDSSKRVLDSAGQGLSTALIGSTFGKLGGAIGITIGSFQILDGVVKELYGNLEEVTAAARERVNQNEKAKQSGDTFIQSRNTLAEAYSSGRQILIEKAERQLSDATLELAESRRKLVDISDPIALARENDRLNSISDRDSNLANAVALAQKSVTDAYSDVFSRLTGRFQKQIGTSAGSKGIAKEIVSGLNLGNSVSDSSLNSQFEILRSGGDIDDFIQTLIGGSGQARDAFDNFAKNFEGGSKALSFSILDQIRVLKDSINFQKQRNEQDKNIALSNSKFEKQLGRSFGLKSISDAARIRTQKDNLDSLDASGFTGSQGAKVSAGISFLRAEQEFNQSASEAASSFLPELQKSLLANVQGQAQRSDLLSSIGDILKDSADPDLIEATLRRTLSFDTGKRVLTELEASLLKYRDSLNLATQVQIESSQKIQRELQKNLNQSPRFGDPFKPQGQNIRDVISGQEFDRTYKPTKEDISGATTANSRLGLERILLERDLPGISRGDTQLRNSAISKFTQIGNANRAEGDSLLFQSLAGNLKGTNKFAFGPQGSNSSFSNFSKIFDNAIKEGDFKDAMTNPVIKGLQGSSIPQAKELLDFISRARDNYTNVPKEAEAQADLFLGPEETLKKIEGNTKNTYESLQKISASQNPESAAKLEKASQDIVRAAEIFSSGSTQKVDVNANLNLAGDIIKGLSSSPELVTAITAALVPLIKSSFSEYYKETTGKTPALLPN